MKVSSNVKPKKKNSNVTGIFKKAEEKAKEKLAADTEKAKKYDEGLKIKAKKFQGRIGGREGQADLAASAAYAGSKKPFTETQRVKGLKETTYYDPKPAVVGGTKKLLVKAKKNVKKSAASAQAKRSAKKLY